MNSKKPKKIWCRPSDQLKQNCIQTTKALWRVAYGIGLFFVFECQKFS